MLDTHPGAAVFEVVGFLLLCEIVAVLKRCRQVCLQWVCCITDKVASIWAHLIWIGFQPVMQWRPAEHACIMHRPRPPSIYICNYHVVVTHGLKNDRMKLFPIDVVLGAGRRWANGNVTSIDGSNRLHAVLVWEAINDGSGSVSLWNKILLLSEIFTHRSWHLFRQLVPHRTEPVQHTPGSDTE